MLSRILLVLACASVISAGIVQHKDCGSTGGVVQVVDIVGCNATPCTLVKGTSASMSLKFTSSVSTTTLTSKVFGVLFGIPIPFPLPDGNSCNLGANCPVSSGDLNEIKISLPILNEYPSLSVDVRWQVIDSNNKVLVCFQIPVKITA